MTAATEIDKEMFSSNDPEMAAAVADAAAEDELSAFSARKLIDVIAFCTAKRTSPQSWFAN